MEERMKQSEWREKAKQLKEEYSGYDELRKHCIEIFTRKYFRIDDMIECQLVTVYVCFLDEDQRFDGIYFKEIEDGKLKKVYADKKTIKEVTDKISKQIDNKTFTRRVVMDALQETHPTVVDEIKEELEKEDTKIKPKKHCVLLQIGSKKLQIR